MAKLVKGGRGQRAPYNTVMVRVPELVKYLADELSAKYRELVKDYQNPNNPALIVALRDTWASPGLEAVAPGASEEAKLDDLHHQLKTLQDCASLVSSENEQIKQLLFEYQQMEVEMEEMKRQIDSLKSTKNKDSIAQAIIDFLEHKKYTYNLKNRKFSLDTRGWDGFREFVKFNQSGQEPPCS